MVKRIALLGSAAASLATVALVLTACSGSAEPAETEAAGQTRVVESIDGPVEIPAHPQRVVAYWGAAEALLTLEGSPLVGVDAVDNRAPGTFGDDEEAWDRYQELPKVGRTLEPDYEAILALEPDLILFTSPAVYWDKLDTDRLNDIAPTVNLTSREVASIGEWKDDFLEIADIVGLSEQAEGLRADYDARAADIHEEHAAKIDGKRFVAIASWAEGTFWNQTAGSYIAHIPEDAGLSFPDAEPHELSTEELGTLAEYDAIVYSLGTDGKPTPQMQAVLDSELFRALPAVQAGRLIPLHYDAQRNYDAALVALDSLDRALAGMPD